MNALPPRLFPPTANRSGGGSFRFSRFRVFLLCAGLFIVFIWAIALSFIDVKERKPVKIVFGQILEKDDEIPDDTQEHVQETPMNADAPESSQVAIDAELKRLRGKISGNADESLLKGAELEDDEEDYGNSLSITHQQPNTSKVSMRAHIFYYSWWGTPEGPLEKRYAHWDHVILPHWEKNVNQRFNHLIGKVHQPPEDLGTNFYPDGGPYSSSSPATIARHMKQIREAGIGVVVLSWYPPNKADPNGHAELADPLMPQLLDACHRESLQLSVHIEPYQGRTAQSVWDDADYINKEYGQHPALYRTGKDRLPLIYVYDSYLIPKEQWEAVGKRHQGAIKNAVYLGLVAQQSHLHELAASSGFFDGFYTYFASEAFVWGSTRANWNYITEFARQRGMIASISVGPGYEDTRIRPWNDVNTRNRMGGGYYRESFSKAADARPEFISITSFNEWHEGTQIEPAIPKPSYSDYAELGPNGYLALTNQLIKEHLTPI